MVRANSRLIVLMEAFDELATYTDPARAGDASRHRTGNSWTGCILRHEPEYTANRRNFGTQCIDPVIRDTVPGDFDNESQSKRWQSARGGKATRLLVCTRTLLRRDRPRDDGRASQAFSARGESYDEEG